MTVVQPNSIAGINSITVQNGDSLAIHKSDGSLLRTITEVSGISTFDGGIKIGTAATVSSIGNIAAAGIVTANGGIQIGTAATIFANGNMTVSGILTASSFSGIDSDKITEGNTTVECVDTGTDGHITFDTEGTEAFRVDRAQRILVGSASSLVVAGSNCSFTQIIGTDYNRSSISMQRFENGASGASLMLSHSRGGSAGSYTVVQDNDELGKIRFMGADGSDMACIGAEIRAEIDGTPGGDDLPTRLLFSTTADGASSFTERIQILPTGDLAPVTDATYECGTQSYRWKNIYTADMQLSNEGSQNEVDGTWGKYTIQEGADDLFLINRRTGKKYKFMLEEVT